MTRVESLTELVQLEMGNLPEEKIPNYYEMEDSPEVVESFNRRAYRRPKDKVKTNPSGRTSRGKK